MAKGRYSDWLEEDNLIRLAGWARDGLTEEQIAHNMGIHVRTLYTWKNKYIQIEQALKRNKEVIDMEVENALLKRALGYEYEETKVTVDKDDSGKERKRIEKTTKQMAPDTTALAIWLNNRLPEKYRRNRNKEVLDEKRFEKELEEMKKKYW